MTARSVSFDVDTAYELVAEHVEEVVLVGAHGDNTGMVTLLYDLLRSHELLLDALCAPAIKVKILEGAVDVDGARLAVHIEALPVVNLEGEYIRRGGDFEHHHVFAL